MTYSSVCHNHLWHCLPFSKNVLSQRALLDQQNPSTKSFEQVQFPENIFLCKPLNTAIPEDSELIRGGGWGNKLLVYFCLALMGEEKLYKPSRALHKTHQYFSFSNIMKFGRWETGLSTSTPNWKSRHRQSQVCYDLAMFGLHYRKWVWCN